MIKTIYSIFLNSSLIWGMAKRDVIGRYNGSIFGVMWSLFNPLLMLLVYTFAFGFIFKSRWPGLGEGSYTYALVLFPALLVFNFFSECVNRAPSLIVSNPSYVKKVVFPLEILSVIATLSALFHFIIGFFVWCVACFFIQGSIHSSIIFVPILILPLYLFTLGITWILASLGVFLRDIQQLIGVVTSALIFVSPVFYTINSVPEYFRTVVQINPLTYFVDSIREVMIYGNSLNFDSWSLALLFSTIVACLGIWWFQLTRRGFSDVV